MAQENINDEIKWLEERLSAKKMELAEGAVSGEKEKEAIKEVIKEATALPPSDFPGAAVPSDDAAQKAADLLEDKEHSLIVESLVEDALKNGLMHAVKTAEAMKNPHILDDFHDTLADKYYQKLLESKKIK